VFLPADLSSLAEMRRLADTVRQNCDRLEILINNAGIGSGGSTQSEKSVKTVTNYASLSIISPDFCSQNCCCLSS
jgi:short-subunit dehydrogenase